VPLPSRAAAEAPNVATPAAPSSPAPQAAAATDSVGGGAPPVDEGMERALRRRFTGAGGAHTEDAGRHSHGGHGLMHFVDRR
jgi:hypothetical protein